MSTTKSSEQISTKHDAHNHMELINKTSTIYNSARQSKNYSILVSQSHRHKPRMVSCVSSNRNAHMRARLLDKLAEKK